MASTPTNRLKLSASNTSLFQALAKSTGRNRTSEPHLSLKRVIGTTCTSPTAFDTAGCCFAYVAGAAVVVVDLDGANYTQRFYRARPTANPVFHVAPISPSSANSNNTTPKANDAKNRVSWRSRESQFGSSDGSSSSSSRTWTSRERIKAATCLSLSEDGRFLAVGETGYAPRVLIFSLKDNNSSDTPLVSISEHGFGVRAVAWSPDGIFLASLGTANDGFLFIWKIDPRTGSARLFQQSRCTAAVTGMMWIGSNLVTFGTRHVRAWKVVDEAQHPPSPTKPTKGSETNVTSQQQKTLPGRNVLLGSLLDASFTCGLPLDDSHALLCSDGGDICILDNTSGQTKLILLTTMEYGIVCCTRFGPQALIGGRNGRVAKLDVQSMVDGASDAIIGDDQSLVVLAAMGFIHDQLVTIDSDRSINIWKAGRRPGADADTSSRTTLPGQNEPVLGIQSLTQNHASRAAFFTWSASGKVLLWTLDGYVQEDFQIAVDQVYSGNDVEPLNQLCAIRADESGAIFVAGDRVGVLRVLDYATRELVLETKAHSSEITQIAVQQNASKTLIATSGRDRMVQIFHRTSTGSIELLQTLEFAARVTHLLLSSDRKIITSSLDRTVQIHDLVSKEEDADTMAAIQSKSIVLKASPTSMALASDCKSVFVSSLDRIVYHIDVETGQPLSAIKCIDENGSDTAVLDSLVFGPSHQDEPTFLLGLSNTDKSVRLYNASTGAFMDREWGHTESINGVVLAGVGEGARKIAVSVASDGTIFIWELNLLYSPADVTSRSPSPAKDTLLGPSRPPLRRVLSKAEIAEFQRPTSSQSGRRSPPRALRPRKSRSNLSTSSSASLKTPVATSFDDFSRLAEETPSRRVSANRSGSPGNTDISPPIARLTRRPSMPALGSTPVPQARKKTSAVNLRASYGTGSLQAASEQTCRQLRAYRKKLSSSDDIEPEMLSELEEELRLTVAAIGERANRSQVAMTEPVLSGLLDRYSEKLLSMLDEKLRVRLGEPGESASRLGVEDGMSMLRLAASGDGAGNRPRTAHGTKMSSA
ncbi:hypothetical protein N0V82_000871 [Gnomoniopsis sp. IMI 355080]|nr:hypothetical protein N0V82_000871 [Gnomoniopsis sp. IMI 355080]